MFASDDHEILDVVDINDKVVGTINRGDAMELRDTSDRYIRAVEMFIQRSNGDIYLPRRSKHKKIAPGGLDLSVAGHVNTGETYEEACIREIKEEVGIVTTINQLVFITKITPSESLLYFRGIYLFRTDIVPILSSEHTEAEWIQPDKLIERLQNDIPTKETLYEDIVVLLDYLKTEQV